jgi:hypothetical protein
MPPQRRAVAVGANDQIGPMDLALAGQNLPAAAVGTQAAHLHTGAYSHLEPMSKRRVQVLPGGEPMFTGFDLRRIRAATVQRPSARPQLRKLRVGVVTQHGSHQRRIESQARTPVPQGAIAPFQHQRLDARPPQRPRRAEPGDRAANDHGAHGRAAPVQAPPCGRPERRLCAACSMRRSGTSHITATPA